MRILTFILILLSTLKVYGGDPEYRGKDKSKWPQTEFSKSKNDFGAWLLITPDTDWQQKWDTPPDTIPSFKDVSKVKRGEPLAILTFFANPKINSKNETNVICSLKVTNPQSVITANAKDIACSKGVLLGNPNNIRLSPAVIQFVGDSNDPFGTWVVDVTINDTNRDTILNLRARFDLVQ